MKSIHLDYYQNKRLCEIDASTMGSYDFKSPLLPKDIAKLERTLGALEQLFHKRRALILPYGVSLMQGLITRFSPYVGAGASYESYLALERLGRSEEMGVLERGIAYGSASGAKSGTRDNAKSPSSKARNGGGGSKARNGGGISECLIDDASLLDRIEARYALLPLIMEDIFVINQSVLQALDGVGLHGAHLIVDASYALSAHDGLLARMLDFKEATLLFSARSLGLPCEALLFLSDEEELIEYFKIEAIPSTHHARGFLAGIEAALGTRGYMEKGSTNKASGYEASGYVDNKALLALIQEELSSILALHGLSLASSDKEGAQGASRQDGRGGSYDKQDDGGSLQDARDTSKTRGASEAGDSKQGGNDQSGNDDKQGASSDKEGGGYLSIEPFFPLELLPVNTLPLRLAGIKARNIIQDLGLKGIYAINGRDCLSGRLLPSFTLRALGARDSECRELLSLSFDRLTQSEARYIATSIANSYVRIARLGI